MFRLIMRANGRCDEYVIVRDDLLLRRDAMFHCRSDAHEAAKIVEMYNDVTCIVYDDELQST